MHLAETLKNYIGMMAQINPNSPNHQKSQFKYVQYIRLPNVGKYIQTLLNN